MSWSLARDGPRKGKLERSPAHCPRKTSLWRSGTGFRRWGNSLNWFFFVLVFCFYFLSAIHVFLVCVLPLAHFLTRCLQCGLSSESLSRKERHHGWDGTLDLHGCCCRWVLWAGLPLFLAGNVVAWLFALIANKSIVTVAMENVVCFAISEEQLLYCGWFLSILDVCL